MSRESIICGFVQRRGTSLEHVQQVRPEGAARSRRALTPSVLASDSPADAQWAYVTRRFRTLGYDFGIQATHEGLGRFIDTMFGACAVEGEPTAWYSIIDGLPGTDPHAVFVDDHEIVRTSYPPYVLRYLTWHVNRQAIASGHGTHVLLHAAAAVKDGHAVLLPAGMEAGKTTLVSGLVSAGYGYLTDEAAAIDPQSLRVHPFPKPLSIDKGSWSVLQDLRPRVDDATAEYLMKQWQVNPQSIPGATIAGPAPISLIVAPRYVRGAATSFRRIGRREMLIDLMSHTFHFHAHGRRNLEVLARVASSAACYRLESGDLGDACRAIDGLLEDSGVQSGDEGFSHDRT